MEGGIEGEKSWWGVRVSLEEGGGMFRVHICLVFHVCKYFSFLHFLAYFCYIFISQLFVSVLGTCTVCLPS